MSVLLQLGDDYIKKNTYSQNTSGKRKIDRKTLIFTLQYLYYSMVLAGTLDL